MQTKQTAMLSETIKIKRLERERKFKYFQEVSEFNRAVDQFQQNIEKINNESARLRKGALEQDGEVNFRSRKRSDYPK